MRSIKTVIGLMSGTSMDGIDAALLQTDGESRVKILGHYVLPYEPEFRRRLEQGLAEAKAARGPQERPGSLTELERDLTLRHAEAVAALLRGLDFTAEYVDFIGFHGQTMRHCPPPAAGKNGFSLQLGDGALLARQSGIAVIADMRANDMRHGGNGAPLVPVYHRALTAGLAGKAEFPLCFVNIGGIANCTYVAAQPEGEATDKDANTEALAAFDCGPGNALIDQWAQKMSGARLFYDAEGQAGLAGKIDAEVAEFYLSLSIFAAERRSYDRADFPPLQDLPAGQNLNYEDGAATLAYIAAAAIFRSFRHLPQPPETLIISGGGARNGAIMRCLRRLAAAAGAEVKTAEELGLSGEFMEAEALAYLAARAFYRLPLTYPATTGCNAPCTGGVFYQP